MNYFNENKKAWEEAFEHKLPGWGEENYERLMNEHLPFFDPDLAKELEALDFKGKTAAQFCCNKMCIRDRVYPGKGFSQYGTGPGKTGTGNKMAECV